MLPGSHDPCTEFLIFAAPSECPQSLRDPEDSALSQERCFRRAVLGPVLPCLSRHGWGSGPRTGRDESVLRRNIGSKAGCSTSLSNKSPPEHELAVIRALLRARARRFDVIYICGQFLASRAALLLAGPLFGSACTSQRRLFRSDCVLTGTAQMEGRLSRKSWLYINDEYHRGYITRAITR